MNLLLTFLFFLALCGTTYFIGRLFTWGVYKINPDNFKNKFTNKHILKTNIVMFISIILWSIIYYFN